MNPLIRFLCLLCVLCVESRGSVFAQPGFFTELTVTADLPAAEAKKLAKPDPRLEQVLEKRLEIFAGEGGSIRAGADGAVVVKVPVAPVLETQVKAFARVGRLEIRHLEDIRTNLNPNGRYLIDTVTIVDRSSTDRSSTDRSTLRFRDRRSDSLISLEEFLKRSPLLFGNVDLEAESARRAGSGLLMAVRLTLTERASDRLDRFGKKPGRLIAIVLDGEIISINAVHRAAPRTKDEEKTLSQIDVVGGFGAPEEADYLATVFNSGPLPYPVRVVSRKVVGE